MSVRERQGILMAGSHSAATISAFFYKNEGKTICMESTWSQGNIKVISVILEVFPLCYSDSFRFYKNLDFIIF